ncbi:restriction endonuclease subunit S [Rhodococcus triatomae]|uniref:Restriction endonuclease S subunit n=1 Tax=Rhodococcus triatomae TaxID=300028 RepID=A0A1G8PWY9_9NOCA|nr:restriction endonuclease subunit S [Rhodococcus triatomae]QNG19240.1 restriction endonuclease subunit S [Rhodococcus triatomae]QNG24847.1 restriction endonuclease subunit S [Rhodococcus triatomae]SDI97014.1 Restriction endonuclease S subunit [Rhodococcus triatomae]
MSEWMPARLGDHLTRVKRKVSLKDGVKYAAVSVTKDGQGLGDKEPFIGGLTNYDSLYRVQAGDVVLRAITAFESPVGIAQPEHAGTHVSGVFLTYEVGPSMLPGYLRLFFQTPLLWREMQQRATGSVLRRKTISDVSFRAIPVPSPALPEQRRIVDIIESVDALVDILGREIASARRVLHCVLTDHFVVATGNQHSVVDLCSDVIGGIWGSPPGEGEVDLLALGPRIYAAGTTGFVTDGSPMRSFSLKQVKRRRVRLNDIILERSGGSPEQPVGRVVIAGEGLSPCIPTDFQRLMRPDPEKVEPRYLFWRLRHDWSTGLTRAFSRRTTGITNLSVKEYIARRVSVPSREDQKALVEAADIVDANITAIKNELAGLRTFRSALLISLLNQEIEIPEPYEALLEEAT